MKTLGFVRLPRPYSRRPAWFKTRRVEDHERAGRTVDKRMNCIRDEFDRYHNCGSVKHLKPGEADDRVVDPCAYADCLL